MDEFGVWGLGFGDWGGSGFRVSDSQESNRVPRLQRTFQRVSDTLRVCRHFVDSLCIIELSILSF